MDEIAHHLPVVYALVAFIVIPLALYLAILWVLRRQQRLAREAMQRGNVLHRDWLERSRSTVDPVALDDARPNNEPR